MRVIGCEIEKVSYLLTMINDKDSYDEMVMVMYQVRVSSSIWSVRGGGVRDG